jgi:CRISPR-associated protein Csd1
MGANIVSVNNKNEGGSNAGATPAFASYGKQQAYNSPISKSAAFAYTTALNHLLGKDSRQRMQVGDASTVFWSSHASDFENEVADFFGEPPKDDPDRNTRAVGALLKSVETGALAKEESANRFYVLGLSPNASRIAVRFWMVDTVPNMAVRFCQHFEDIRIAHGPREPATLSLFRLLVSTASLGKSENIPPNIAGDTMRAILEGRPYPQSLLQAAIRRIRADHELTYPRAALIKACINRGNRFKNTSNTEELKVSLDLNNANIGYRLGRLFAVLEKLQSEANPGLNATIRDKFYGAASSTPVTVFGNLMRLKNHHLAKLENAGRRITFERLIAEVVSGFADFPSHLTLEDQGRFAIGYYHQMHAFYTKKTETNQVQGE